MAAVTELLRKNGMSDQLIKNFNSVIENLESDPNTSIMKSALILEEIIQYFLDQENIYYNQSDNLNFRIKAISDSGLLPRSITDAMHSIRKIRNSGPSHFDPTNKVFTTDAEFSLKQLYQILEYILNYGKKHRISLDPFDEYLSSIKINKQSNNQSDLLVKRELHKLPVFFVDPEILPKYASFISSLEEEKDERLLKVINLYLTTKLSFSSIEDNVFKQNKGEIAYAIINLYKNIGLTRTWREFIIENGITDTKKIIDDHINESPLDQDYKKKLSDLSEVLEMIS